MNKKIYRKDLVQCQLRIHLLRQTSLSTWLAVDLSAGSIFKHLHATLARGVSSEWSSCNAIRLLRRRMATVASTFGFIPDVLWWEIKLAYKKM